MIALIQRVKHAEVVVNDNTVGKIGVGILALIAIEPTDTESVAQHLLDRIVNYRVFSNEKGRMDLSLAAIAGELLLVPQFTLAAETGKGLKPSFSKAAPPELAQPLFEYFCKLAKKQHQQVSTGVFGADMAVSLTNDGPVTFWLQSS